MAMVVVVSASMMMMVVVSPAMVASSVRHLQLLFQVDLQLLFQVDSVLDPSKSLYDLS